MTKYLWTAALAFALPAALVAQQPLREISKSTDPATIYEDIETLQAVLAKKLQPFVPAEVHSANWLNQNVLYGIQLNAQPAIHGLFRQYMSNPATSFTPNNQTDPQYRWLLANPATNAFWVAPAPKPEGVYLPDQGIIVTLTLPKPKGDPKPGGVGAPAAPAKATDWDTARRELRGQKLVEPKPEKKAEPTLGDVLVQVLAENGHHFGQLTPGERLTVIVTLRGGDDGVAEAKPEKKAEVSAEVRELLKLAELHVNEGKLPDALSAYAKALAQKSDEGTRADIAARLNHLTKLLQEHDANAATKRALEYLRAAKDYKAQMGLAKLAQTTTAKPRLPAKLIVSATKAQLDGVAAGKIVPAEFRKLVSVEYLTFDAK